MKSIQFQKSDAARRQSYGTLDAEAPDEPGSTRQPQSLPRPQWTRLLLCTLLFLAISLVIAYLSWGSYLGDPHTPTLDIPNGTFAVGFDLTAGYGAAAITFRNGTTVDVATVEGDSHYNEVMARLSLESSKHPTPPYYGRGQCGDIPRQSLRKLRKMFGKPASADVAALAKVLQSLVLETNAYLGSEGSVKHALVTVPHLPALYNEDLVDACEAVGIRYLVLPGWTFRSGDQAQWPVSELNTALAGNLLGLCDRFATPEQCKGPAWECTPEGGDENVFSVLFTRQALSAYVLPICGAMHYFDAEGVSNYSLGFGAISDFSSPAAYWEQVRSLLRWGLESYLQRGNTLSLVVAHGESAANKVFQSILRYEVRMEQIGERDIVYAIQDPVFAAARGAAEFTRRCMLYSEILDCIPDLSPRGPGW